MNAEHRYIFQVASQMATFGIISLTAFIALGSQIAFGIGRLWLLGAIVGGWVITEDLWKLRRVHLAKP